MAEAKPPPLAPDLRAEIERRVAAGEVTKGPPSGPRDSGWGDMKASGRSGRHGARRTDG